MVNATEVGFILRENHPLFYHTSKDSSLSRLHTWSRESTACITWACWKVERSQPGRTSSQAGSRRARLGCAANHHVPHVAESIVGDTGSLARDAKESGEYARGDPDRILQS